MLVLTRRETDRLLEEDRAAVREAVADAYVRHAASETSVPYSSFLRFPDDGAERIICLPAYRGGQDPVAGMKWVSSWPGNVDAGMERASAVVVLNSMQTGRPQALLEASGVSAQRTAASAAIAAEALHPARSGEALGLIGCGRINLEVARQLSDTGWAPSEVIANDMRADRAKAHLEACRALWPEAASVVADRPEDVLAAAPLVSVATTETAPHIEDGCLRDDGTVLHLSLRDLSVTTTRQATNVVDDADHVCRERTSVHLTAEALGHRRFISAEIGDLLADPGAWRRPAGPVVFSPFGLGVLDIAVASHLHGRALARGLGTVLDGFCDPVPPDGQG